MTFSKCIFDDVLKKVLLAATLSIVNGTLGCRGSPVGNHWSRMSAIAAKHCLYGLIA